MTPYVVFENVSKVYDTEGIKVNALHDVSFEIGQGEVCIIVGQSGAGKTTLFNIFGGMDTLTGGRVFLGGEEVSALQPAAAAALPPRGRRFRFSVL